MGIPKLRNVLATHCLTLCGKRSVFLRGLVAPKLGWELEEAVGKWCCRAGPPGGKVQEAGRGCQGRVGGWGGGGRGREGCFPF